jgi:polyhydroxybutyrate depolymerase
VTAAVVALAVMGTGAVLVARGDAHHATVADVRVASARSAVIHDGASGVQPTPAVARGDGKAVVVQPTAPAGRAVGATAGTTAGSSTPAAPASGSGEPSHGESWSPTSSATTHRSTPTHTTASNEPDPAGPRPPASAGVDWVEGTMRVGDMNRGWWLAVPQHSRSGRLPLLVVLHGRDATPASETSRTDFVPYVADGRAIAVYPAGWEKSWNAGRCCGRAHAAGVDDRTFLRELIGRLTARADVDAAQVDLVGFSNGGKMAFDLVCTGVIRPHAVVVAEAVPTTDCSHAPAVPLAQIAGERDPLVPYRTLDPSLTADGVPLVPVLTEMQDWAARNGCSGDLAAPEVTPAGDHAVDSWAGCTQPVVLLDYPDGVHTWQHDATQYLWDFMTAGLSA